MATPEDYAAALFDYAGVNIAQLVRERVRTRDRILDIGAGWGKYRWLLPEYEMDAVEVWEPYIDEHKLTAYYAEVYRKKAWDLSWDTRWSAVIMGDVLEHIPVVHAQHVVAQACRFARQVFVATPFEMEQHEVDGNPYEEHVQADLTEEIMAERYPQLELWGMFGRPGEHVKAIYQKRVT